LIQNILSGDLDAVLKQLQLWNHFIDYNKVATSTSKPIHFVMALDNSGSMRFDNELPWRALVEAVVFYVNRRIDKGGENDVVSLILYDDEVQENSCVYGKPIKELQGEVKHILERVPQGGGTEFGVAITKSHEVIAAIDKTMFHIAYLFLSDGASSTGNTEIQQLGNTFGPDGLMTFVFAFGEYADQNKLQTLADLHGHGAKFLRSDISQLAVESQVNVIVETVSDIPLSRKQRSL